MSHENPMLPPLAALLSADNGIRKAAEAALDRVQCTHPAALALALVGALVTPNGNGEWEMAAVLSRRIIPRLLSVLPPDSLAAVKAGILQALANASSSPSMHRKLCDTVGRIAAEFHAQGSWPELNNFLERACREGEPSAHETALTILEHMAPALISSWSASGARVHAVCLGGLASTALSVRLAAMRLLATLLRTCAELEEAAAKPSQRKGFKAIAMALSEALPQMLSALEALSASRGDGGETTRGSVELQAAACTADRALTSTWMLVALESLATVAELHPRMFKPVLPTLGSALSAMARTPSLSSECRVAAVELLLTLAEGAPKMCAKVDSPSYTGLLLDALLPMMLALPNDTSAWAEGEPADGLMQGDEEDADETEATYALEALDRLGGALDGSKVGAELLLRLHSLHPADGSGEIGGGWQRTYVVLVGASVVSEHCPAVLRPHLPSLVASIVSHAGASEVRVRWAAFYALAVLADEFSELADAHHPQVLPTLVAGLADAAPRVRAASAVAAGQLAGQLAHGVLVAAAEPLLAQLYRALTSPALPMFAVHVVVDAMASVVEHAGSVVGSAAYTGMMPLLRSRLGHAVTTRAATLVGTLVGAVGALVRAAGDAVLADAQHTDDVRSLAALLIREEIGICHVDLVRDRRGMEENGEALVQGTLAAYAKLLGCEQRWNPANVIPSMRLEVNG